MILTLFSGNRFVHRNLRRTGTETVRSKVEVGFRETRRSTFPDVRVADTATLPFLLRFWRGFLLRIHPWRDKLAALDKVGLSPFRANSSSL